MIVAFGVAIVYTPADIADRTHYNFAVGDSVVRCVAESIVILSMTFLAKKEFEDIWVSE
jgi:hypothetical protein